MIQLKDVCFRYPDYPGFRSQTLFNNLNLTLTQAQTGIVFGKPDSGKTTLSRILLGLVPRFTGGQLQGMIRLNDRDVLHSKPFELMETIGIAYQNSDEQLFTTRCDTEVAFALESLGLDRDHIARRVERSLERLGLSAFKDRNPATLSGGEKKKLLLACLFAVDPEIWVLDEIFEELDPEARALLFEQIVRRGKTILVLTSKWLGIYRTPSCQFTMIESGKAQGLVRKPQDNGLPILEQRGFRIRHARRGNADRGAADCQADHVVDGAPLLHLQDVTFSYADGGFSVTLERLSIRGSETLAVVGRNGSGKSTLARLLCGILTPHSGAIHVHVDGRSVAGTPALLNTFTGYMFQNPDYQIFLPTVEDELAAGLRLRGESRSGIDARVNQAIELFRLPTGATPPALMSYGARKRLQAAVYYLLERPLLILDEADSGLSAEDIWRLLENLRDGQRALMLITHDVEIALAVSDRLVAMRTGRIVAQRGRDRFGEPIPW